jgi:ATP-dependent exoDNAse (exonuclease V) alpha subunit
MPLSIAYTLTVHKTQGLTLERAQVSLSERFMSQPAMVYVALSRVRSPEGLSIIGSPLTLSEWCTTHPSVQAYV